MDVHPKDGPPLYSLILSELTTAQQSYPQAEDKQVTSFHVINTLWITRLASGHKGDFA
jgi:hypothetical protein